MNKQEAEKLIETIRSLIHHPIAETPAKKPNGKALTLERTMVEGTDNVGGHLKPFELPELETLYQQFKNRLIEECAIDPTLLHLLTTRPEIVVDVERNEVNLDGSSLKGRIARLAAEGFLGEPRKAADISRQMERTGPSVNSGDLSKALKDMRRLGLLTADDGLWQLAAGVKITERTIANR